MKTTIFLIFITFLVIFFAEPNKVGKKNNLASRTMLKRNDFNPNGWVEKTGQLKNVQKIKRYKALIKKTSKKYKVSESLALSVCLIESGANPDAVSPAGAIGLYQLMPRTAKWLGVKDSYDPNQNIEGGIKYLAKLHKQFGKNWNTALIAYNIGPGNVRKLQKKGTFSLKNYEYHLKVRAVEKLV